MKKLLLGCGCLVLVLLGGFAFMVFRMAPHIERRELVGQQVSDRLHELDASHPFAATLGEGLDATRFARALELRALLARRLADDEDARREREDPSAFTVVPNLIDRVNAMLSAIPDVLDAHAMGPSELGYHTRLFWAALESASADASDPLVALGRRHAELRGAWEFMSRNQPAPDLDELIDRPATPLVLAAREVIAADPGLAALGVMEAAVEGLLLALPDVEQVFIEVYSDQRMAELIQRVVGDP